MDEMVDAKRTGCTDLRTGPDLPVGQAVSVGTFQKENLRVGTLTVCQVPVEPYRQAFHAAAADDELLT